MNAISVNTKSYTGPIDILLSLVEKREVEINVISLADITEDYLAILQEKETYILEDMADFLFIASVLVYIKSKTLLPFLTKDDEYESDAFLLQQRILFQKVLKKITKIGIKKSTFGYINTQRQKQYPVKFYPPNFDDNLEQLENSICSFLKYTPKQKQEKKVTIENVVKIGDVIKVILKHLKEIKQFNFSEVADSSSKKNLIVSFLAILELIRNGSCIAIQNDSGNINIQKI